MLRAVGDLDTWVKILAPGDELGVGEEGGGTVATSKPECRVNTVTDLMISRAAGVDSHRTRFRRVNMGTLVNMALQVGRGFVRADTSDLLRGMSTKKK